MSGMEVDNDAGVTRKGRHFASGGDSEDVESDRMYDSISTSTVQSSDKALRSIEGWIIIVRGVHEEASEEDLQDKFGDFGQIRNLHLNLDRRTGFVKGYALIEYEKKSEAEAAIRGANGSQLLEQELTCDFAFHKPSTEAFTAKVGARGNGRGRSQSPTRRKPLVTRID